MKDFMHKSFKLIDSFYKKEDQGYNKTEWWVIETQTSKKRWKIKIIFAGKPWNRFCENRAWRWMIISIWGNWSWTYGIVIFHRNFACLVSAFNYHEVFFVVIEISFDCVVECWWPPVWFGIEFWWWRFVHRFIWIFLLTSWILFIFSD